MNSHPLRFGRAAIALVTLAAVLAACSGWKTIEPPYQRALEHPRQPTVRVTRGDGQALTLYRVVVTPDSVIGYRRLRPPFGRTAIALANVQRIQTEHENTLLGLGIVLGTTLGIIVLVVGLFGFSQWPS